MTAKRRFSDQGSNEASGCNTDNAYYTPETVEVRIPEAGEFRMPSYAAHEGWHNFSPRLADQLPRELTDGGSFGDGHSVLRLHLFDIHMPNDRRVLGDNDVMFRAFMALENASGFALALQIWLATVSQIRGQVTFTSFANKSLEVCRGSHPECVEALKGAWLSVGIAVK
jgi:hypothetical protein